MWLKAMDDEVREMQEKLKMHQPNPARGQVEKGEQR